MGIKNITKYACDLSEKDIKKIKNVNDMILFENKKKFHNLQTFEDFNIFYDKLYYGTKYNYIYNYKFVIKIHRKNAEIYYIIYCDVSYHLVNDTYYVHDLNILGSMHEEHKHFGKYKANSFNLKNKNGVDCSMVNSVECNTIITSDRDYYNRRNKFLNDKTIEDKKTEEDKLFRCFYKDALTKQDKGSYESLKNKILLMNIKKPVYGINTNATYNEECPFYKTNKNYPNRGGCGRCELPLNLKHITPLKYSKYDKPLCHNCKKTNCEV